MLLVSAADGGYDVETGFDPSAPGPVPDSPELLTPEEWQARVALAAAEAALAADAELAADGALAVGPALAADAALTAEALVDAEDDPDEAEPRRWQSLDQHSEQVRDQAAALLAVLAPSIPPEAARSAVIAGYLHDLGKAHEIWQNAICAVADEEDRARIEAGRPWAKSGGNGALLFADGVAFRHELASLLLIDGPLAALLAESPDPDLTKYLVLAHHGKLRMQVRERDAPLAPSDAVDSGPTRRSQRSGPRASHQATSSAACGRARRPPSRPCSASPPPPSPSTSPSSSPTATARGRAPCTVCSTATAPSPSPTWKRSSASPTGGPAAAGNSRPPERPASLGARRRPRQRPAGVGGARPGSPVRRSGSVGS